MIEKIIDFSAHNKFLVLILTAAVITLVLLVSPVTIAGAH